MLICFTLTATAAQSWSAEKGIFFSYSTAQRLYVDIQFMKAGAVDKGKRLELCNTDRTLLEQQAALLNSKIGGLELDKAEYFKESNQFRDLYVKADQDRVKAENDSPSRLRWFGVGAASALAVLLTLFIVKR